MARKEEFNKLMVAKLNEKASNTKILKKCDYDALVNRLRRIKDVGPCSTDKADYRVIKKYDIQKVGPSFIIFKKNSDKALVYTEQVFDIINDAHQATQHGGRQVTLKQLREKYWNVTQELVTLFIEGCENCQMKRKKISKGLVVKPLVSSHMNSRCQIDLIDLQTRPDGEFKFILVYQDHLTKYLRLKALKRKTAKEIAYNLLDIFADLGAPCVLHSDNGREFSNQIVNELIDMWPECHLVHGKPRHSQSQGSVERANQDIESKLACWMKDNNTTAWSEGLRYVQFAKNRCFHSGIGRSPYEAMFGVSARDGLRSLPVSREILKDIRSEEELEALINAHEEEGEKENEAKSNNEISPNASTTNTEDDTYKAVENLLQTENVNINNESTILFPQGSNCLTLFVNKDGSSTMEFLLDTENNIDPDLSRSAVQMETISSQNMTTQANEDMNEEIVQKAVPDPICSLCSNEAFPCDHCNNAKNIENTRLECKVAQKKQAERMLQTTQKKFKPAKIGMSVRIPVPDVDRSRTDHRNLLGVIMDIEDDDFYRLGTLHGVLKQLFSRNQFEICKQKFLSIEDVKDTEITLRTAVGCTSISGSTQGYVRCQCTKRCINKKCKCVGSGLTCNSKCHQSKDCANNLICRF